MPWRDDRIKRWLDPERSGEAPYWHLRLEEVPDNRQAGLDALRDLVEIAHRDALNRLEEAVAPSLAPTAGGAVPLPGSNYPSGLHTTTLQGYMGEVMAGLIAENFGPLETEWEVPAFTFRAHDAAFHHLEKRRLTGIDAHPVPGKGGNDCLAFQRDGDQILAFLVCEAKCTQDHRSELINEGHQQLSENEAHIPVDLMQLIEVLRANGETQWVKALSALLIVSADAAPKHCDLFVYVCGRGRQDGGPWIAAKNAHYRATRELEAAELRLESFAEVLGAAYPGHEVERDSDS